MEITKKLNNAGPFNQIKFNSTKYNHVMPESGPKKLRDIIDDERRKEKNTIKKNS